MVFGEFVYTILYTKVASDSPNSPSVATHNNIIKPDSSHGKLQADVHQPIDKSTSGDKDKHQAFMTFPLLSPMDLIQGGSPRPSDASQVDTNDTDIPCTNVTARDNRVELQSPNVISDSSKQPTSVKPLKRGSSTCDPIPRIHEDRYSSMPQPVMDTESVDITPENDVATNIMDSAPEEGRLEATGSNRIQQFGSSATMDNIQTIKEVQGGAFNMEGVETSEDISDEDKAASSPSHQETTPDHLEDRTHDTEGSNDAGIAKQRVQELLHASP